MALRPLNTLGNRRGEAHDGSISSRPRSRSGSHMLGKREVFADIERGSKRRKLEQHEDSLQESEEDELVQDPSPRRNGARASNVFGSRYGSQSIVFPPEDFSVRRVEDLMKSHDYVSWSKNNQLTKRSTGPVSHATVRNKEIVQTRSLGMKSTAKSDREVSLNGKKGLKGPPRTPRSPTSVQESSSPDILSSTIPNLPATHVAHRQPHEQYTFDEQDAGPNDYEDVFSIPLDDSTRKVSSRSPSIEIKSEQNLKQLSRKGRPQRRLLSQNQMPTRKFKPASLNLPIDYFAARNVIIRENGMRLTAQDDSQQLLVEVDGTLKEETVFLLAKIQKVERSSFESAVRIRLHLPQNHNYQGFEGYKVDIKFREPSDLNRFSEFLRFRAKLNNFYVLEESKLERMFYRRETTQNEYHTDRIRRSQMDDPDVILAMDQQQKRTSLMVTSGRKDADQTRSRKKLISRLERDATGPRRNPDDAVRAKSELEQDIFVGPTKSRDRHLLNDKDNDIHFAGLDTLSSNRSSRRTRRSSNSIVFDDLSQSQMAISQPKYSIDKGLGPPWRRPLEYPKTGKKRVTVEFGDLIRLDEGECLNDNLVEFHLRRLQINLEAEKPQVAKKIYWFNTYFYESLSKNVRGKNEINYDSVKRWTRSEDIFGYDYVVVPINESYHWYVVIICNLPALSHSQGADKQLPDGDDSSISLLDDTQTSLQLLTNSSHTLQQPVDEPSTRRSFSELKLEDDSSSKKLEGLEIASKENSLDISLSKSIDQPKRDLTPQKTVELIENSPDGNPKGENPGKIPMEEEITRNHEHVQAALLETNGTPPSTQTTRGASRKKKGPPLRTYDPTEPAIITLDSLGVPHAPTVRALKTYLMREAVDKKGEPFFSDSQLKGMNAKGIPQQDNFVDCGLYLLGYMEKFASNPSAFVSSILQKQFDEYKDWPSLKPNSMRAALREEIFRLHREQEEERTRSRSTPGSSAKKRHIQRSVDASIDQTGESRDGKNLHDSIENPEMDSLKTALKHSETTSSVEASAPERSRRSPLQADENNESIQAHQASQQLQIALAESQLSSEETPDMTTKTDSKARELVTVMVPDSQERATSELDSEFPVELAKTEVTYERPPVLSHSEVQTIKSSPKQQEVASEARTDSPSEDARRRRKRRSKSMAGDESSKKEPVVISIDDN